MNISKSDIIGKIRTAIDDIAPSASDSFSDDVNTELWQAVKHAVTELSIELPINLLEASIKSEAGTVDNDRGFAYLQLPDKYLRFVSLDVEGWAGILTELIEPGSDAEKMQRSPWSRGTSTKPKAMIDHDETGKKVIVWWPGDDTHKTGQLTYIANYTEVTVATSEITSVPTLTCAIRSEAEQYVIYRAASIFFEGKKEDAIAEKFRSMSNTF